MKVTPSKEEILSTLSADKVKLGDIKKIAKSIKTDHTFAMELWRGQAFYQRMLSVLIMDKKLVDMEFIYQLADEVQTNQPEARSQIIDWFMANQLMKSRRTVALLETWEKEESPTLRRMFWYHQARLRWTGNTPPGNTAQLVDSLESDMSKAEPEVQWAMNMAAGWIGIYEPAYRQRCLELGEKLGLYKGDKCSKGCTPSYLPEFIRIEVGKRGT